MNTNAELMTFYKLVLPNERRREVDGELQVCVDFRRNTWKPLLSLDLVEIRQMTNELTLQRELLRHGT